MHNKMNVTTLTIYTERKTNANILKKKNTKTLKC